MDYRNFYIQTFYLSQEEFNGIVTERISQIRSEASVAKMVAQCEYMLDLFVQRNSAIIEWYLKRIKDILYYPRRNMRSGSLLPLIFPPRLVQNFLQVCNNMIIDFIA
jgi:hypothetical protein